MNKLGKKNIQNSRTTRKLETYTDIIQAAIVDAQDSVAPAINQLHNLLPEDLRITIINKEGKVLFDNSINDYVRLDNHKDRPEIVKAQQTGKGSYLRLSDSNKHKYLYFAKKSRR